MGPYTRGPYTSDGSCPGCKAFGVACIVVDNGHECTNCRYFIPALDGDILPEITMHDRAKQAEKSYWDYIACQPCVPECWQKRKCEHKRARDILDSMRGGY